MKVIAIGDIHGRNTWEKISTENFDYFIFIGDYFDPYEDIPIEEEIDNFKQIINFKKKFPEKVILLFGNHDFHYLNSTKQKYSRYNFDFHTLIDEVVELAMDEKLFQMCFQYEHYLFSHAGITKTWLEKSALKSDENLVENINNLLYENPQVFEFRQLKDSKSNGNNIYQSPIWVRPESLEKDALEKVVHVIGHSKKPYITFQNNIIFIDVLKTTQEYLCIENDTISPKKIL